MTPLLKLEILIVRLASARLARLIATLFPAALQQGGKSYLYLFVLGIITIVCTELYNSSASQNDRTYVAFIMMLSFVWTSKAIIVSVTTLAAAWLLRQKQLMTQTAEPRSSQSAATAIGLISLATLSLIPPIIVFKAQDLIWAEHMCVIGFFFFSGAVILLTLLAYNFSRIRNLAGKLPEFLPRIPLIDFSNVAGRLYQESGKPLPPLA